MQLLSIDSSAPMAWFRRRGELLVRAAPVNKLFAYAIAVLLTHALLRAALLFRSNAHGQPFVGKVDWYLFHALAIDWLWISLCSLPLLVACVLSPSWYRLWASLLIAMHSLLLLATEVDHESLRFWGMHADASFLTTYGNAAGAREALVFLSDDRSIRYLPLLLLVGVVPFSLGLWKLLLRRWVWATAPSLNRSALAWGALANVVAWLFVGVLWTGGFRMQKLRPVVQTLWAARESNSRPKLDPNELKRLTARFSLQWLTEQGDDAFVFSKDDYPYFKQPLMEACRNPSGDLGQRCGLDQDGDGHPARSDCDDHDGFAHPGAVETPADGIDQDCSGLDERPVNFVFMIMETHRALDVGHLGHWAREGGRTVPPSATPWLDSLAEQGSYWTRFSVAGIPTINALMGMHLSVVQHPRRYIASEFTRLAHQSFPRVLAQHGYLTHFFSAADPAWDGQTPWLAQWYDGVSYDRSREDDCSMLSEMSSWMRAHLKEDRPFLMTAITKTNHYPFNAAVKLADLPEDAPLSSKIRVTMAYTDSCVKRMMQSLSNEPWYGRTLFVLTGDHGFPLGEHGSSNIGYGLYPESTWVPFVIYGKHPRLTPGANHAVASQLDIAPTLLDLAGIRVANSFMGHSLLRRHGQELATAYQLRGDESAIETARLRVHGGIGGAQRERGPEVFEAMDRMEWHNVLPRFTHVYAEWHGFLADLERLHTEVVEQDRLWPRN